MNIQQKAKAPLDWKNLPFDYSKTDYNSGITGMAAPGRPASSYRMKLFRFTWRRRPSITDRRPSRGSRHSKPPTGAGPWCSVPLRTAGDCPSVRTYIYSSDPRWNVHGSGEQGGVGEPAVPSAVRHRGPVCISAPRWSAPGSGSACGRRRKNFKAPAQSLFVEGCYKRPIADTDKAHCVPGLLWLRGHLLYIKKYE